MKEISKLSNNELQEYGTLIANEITQRVKKLELLCDNLAIIENEAFEKCVFPCLIDFIKQEFDYTIIEIKSPSRKRGLVEIRHLIVLAILESGYYKPTLESLGFNFLGGRDHTTIIHSKSAALDLIETDEEIAEKYQLIQNKLIELMVYFGLKMVK